VSFLLDTNVLSELRKRSPQPNVVTWFELVPSKELFLSVLVVGEIRQGIERLRPRDRVRADVFEQWLETLLHDYQERVVPITSDIAQEWGRLNASATLPIVDGLLAATAKVHDWTLVTRNTTDVIRAGVNLLNPFEPQGTGT
jgi:hypothetical protein